MFHSLNAKRKLVLVLTLIFAISFISSSVNYSIYAAPGSSLADKIKEKFPEKEKEIDLGGITSDIRYPDFLEDMRNQGIDNVKGIDPVEVDLTTARLPEGFKKEDYIVDEYEGRQGTSFNWSDHKLEWVEFKVNVPASGLYNIEIDYFAPKGTTQSPQRIIHVDGKLQYKEAGMFGLPRIWRDDLEKGEEPRENNVGDQIRPRQVQNFQWQYGRRIVDFDGKYAEPLKYYFTQGEHTIRLLYVYEPLVIGSIRLVAPKELKSYKEVEAEYKAKGYKTVTQSFRIQGEKVSYKSDSSLRLESSADPKADPPYKGYTKLNVIGKDRWSQANQSLTWELEVPETGLYKISMRVYQRYTDGLPVYRQIAINGEVPFKEFLAYKFEFEDWSNITLQSPDGKPYLVYLEAGKVNTLTMTVKLGEFTDIMNSLEDDAVKLSENVKDIIRVTGITPDTNFRYELFAKIPGLKQDFIDIVNSFNTQVERIRKLSKKRPSAINNFQMMSTQLGRMIQDQNVIPRSLEDLTNAQSSLATWIKDFGRQPLEIDYIELLPEDHVVKNVRANFIDKLIASVRTFIQSFFKDYDAIPAATDETGKEYDTLSVWVARGKEWAEILKQQADEEFTPGSAIFVNMNILPAGQLGGGSSVLLLALASGTGPDVALGVASNIPVEYGMRGAVADLSVFKGDGDRVYGFDEVKTWFLEGIMVPFQFKGGYYGLPETMDFSALYYRKDILEEYDLEIPETWQDVYTKILPTLKKNGMDFFYASGFHPFLMQYGGSYYRTVEKDGYEILQSNLDAPEAYRAFEQFTNLYRIYDVPVQADFYNRFRSGQMPMGIANFDTYIKLSSAAPEIYGKWDVAPIPGVMMEDGTINRASGGAGTTAAIMLSHSEKKEKAWEFLQWYTSEETQARYANDIVAIIGPEARWNSANINAFNQLPWDANLRNVIEVQKDYYMDAPNVIGGYIVGRWIENARVGVVVEKKPFRPQLEKAIKEINYELEIKHEEFRMREEYEKAKKEKENK